MRHRQTVRWFTQALLLVLACSFTMGSVITHAADASVWGNTNQIAVKQTGWMTNEQYTDLLNTRRGFDQVQQCINKKITIMPLKVLGRYKEGCWYATKIGLLSQDGKYLLEPGSTTAGYIKASPPDTSILKPTANPDVFLELQPDAATGYGYFVRFRRLAQLSFNATTSTSSGAITLEYASVPSGYIASSLYNSVNILSHQVWYSSDAKWMLTWSEKGNLYKTNLETLKTQALYITASQPIISTGSAAISADGRYVAVAVQQTNQEQLFVVDVNSCNVQEAAYITATAKCTVVTLKNSISTKMASFTKPSIPKFYADDMLAVHVLSGEYWREYTIGARGSVTSGTAYMALGDSFSSGEGAGNYYYGTDVRNDNMCHTSLDSYPYLINNRLNLEEFHSVACSGAKIRNVLTKAQYEDTDKIAQIFPGSGIQIKLLGASKVGQNIVTISMSGNDIGFTDIVKTCVTSASECYKYYEERKEITNRIDNLIPKLVSMYQTIKQNMAPGGRLYVVGYPQIISPSFTADCNENVKMSDQERVAANDLVTYFNSVIKYSATKAGAFYTGVEGALAGHRLCDGPSATIGVNGITIGDETGYKDKIRVLSKGTYHPNALGHQLLASAVLKQTDSLTAEMPGPDAVPAKPDAEKSAFLQNLPRVPRPVRSLNDNDNSVDEILLRGNKKAVNISDPSLPTAPNTTYRIELHSEPVVLGQIISDNIGSIITEVQIPTGTEPGFHELHIIGPGLNGDEIDIVEHFYVGATQNDFDGDGIVNADGPCGLLESSGQDIDEDGVDDACDGFIGQPKPKTAAPTSTRTPEQNPASLPPESQSSSDTSTPAAQTANGNQKDAVTEKPAVLPTTAVTTGVSAASPVPTPTSVAAVSTGMHRDESIVDVLSAHDSVGTAASNEVAETQAMRYANSIQPLRPQAFREHKVAIMLTIITVIGYSIFIYARKKTIGQTKKNK